MKTERKLGRGMIAHQQDAEREVMFSFNLTPYLDVPRSSSTLDGVSMMQSCLQGGRKERFGNLGIGPFQEPRRSTLNS